VSLRTVAAREEIAPASDAVRADEFRAALEQTLELAESDQRIGPMLAASKLRMRFRFPDSGLELNIAAGEAEGEGGGRNLSWSFGDVDWTPKLELTMESAVANRFLQGRESLAIAIARGRARYRGESHSALLGLPATRLLCEPYREVVRSGFPELAR
jgi:hypothetical protein